MQVLTCPTPACLEGAARNDNNDQLTHAVRNRHTKPLVGIVNDFSFFKGTLSRRNSKISRSLFPHYFYCQIPSNGPLLNEQEWQV